MSTIAEGAVGVREPGFGLLCLAGAKGLSP